MQISNVAHLLMNRPPVGKLLRSLRGPTELMAWNGSCEPEDAQRPPGPFGSDSDSLASLRASWLPVR